MKKKILAQPLNIEKNSAMKLHIFNVLSFYTFEVLFCTYMCRILKEIFTITVLSYV